MKKIIVPILAIFFMNCEVTDTKEATNSAAALEALNEYVAVNKVFQDVGNNTGDAILTAQNSASTSKLNSTKTDGPTITVTPLDATTFPKTITIDYKTGVLCKDGVTRKGIVTIVSTNWYRTAGSEHTATFTNYYHNEFKVEGTHYVKNLGKNQNENLEYSVSIENGKIITTSDKSISYTETSKRTWIAGADTPFNIWDDEYLLDGSQSGTSSKGISYALTIEESLHFVLYPRAITAGILNVDVADLKNIKLNYNTSTITILGISFPFGN